MIASSAAADALVAAAAGSGPTLGTVLPLLTPSPAASALSSASSFASLLFAPLTTGGELLSSGWEWVKQNKAKVAGGALVTGAVAGYVVYRKVQPMMSVHRSARCRCPAPCTPALAALARASRQVAAPVTHTFRVCSRSAAAAAFVPAARSSARSLR